MIRLAFTSFCFLLLTACQQEGKTTIELDELSILPSTTDLDGDGYAGSEDCDDSSSGSNPGAIEICDGLDNDCDGSIDEGVNSIFYIDGDDDGFGSSDETVEACEPPDGYVPVGNDCDDADAAIYPGATEVCDLVDNNCDGVVDDGNLGVWYPDNDGDGYGDLAGFVEGCAPDDSYVAVAGDCDDTQAAINPGASEVCDGLDNNCDTVVDEGVENTYYGDADSDGYGNGDDTIQACELPAGYVEDATDCDDSDTFIHPGMSELCNNMDDDCDGSIDEDVAAQDWYRDDDGDGYGDASQIQTSCQQLTGYVLNDTDCDDANAAINPGQDELCNNLDDDCDGTIDGANAIDQLTWYIDVDGDDFGSIQYTMTACEQPNGWVDNSSDCDDAAATVYPGANEYCNGIDDDCDGDIDNNSVNALTWYEDSDCDGYGDDSMAVDACEAPANYVAQGGDCDDADPWTHPSAQEICLDSGPLDHDCDGVDDNDCLSTFVAPVASAAAVENPAHPGACGRFSGLSTSTDTHLAAYLPTFMAGLEVSTTALDVDVQYLDYSTYCGGDYSASPGNFASTQPWAGSVNGNVGAARIRGYLHLQCGDALHYTFGFIGNDALTLSIEGEQIFSMDWYSTQWKRFRYVSFPGPGLYAFEIQWSTNFNCDYDPMELIWEEGLRSGYDNYNSMCYGSYCSFDNNVPIPGFAVVTSDHLLQSTTGDQLSCASCSSDSDCSTNNCNSAGLCE